MWARYPGRLAHLEGDRSAPIVLNNVRVGTRWSAICGRDLRLFWDERPWQITHVDVFELRLEQPRGWCLRCGYWAARDALVMPRWNFDDFVAAVHAGRWPVTIGEGGSVGW